MSLQLCTTINICRKGGKEGEKEGKVVLIKKKSQVLFLRVGTLDRNSVALLILGYGLHIERKSLRLHT